MAQAPAITSSQIQGIKSSIDTNPTDRLILPSVAEDEFPWEGMPDVKTLDKWQSKIEQHARYSAKDKKSGYLVGSEAALLCEYMPVAMFPQHDFKTRKVVYRYNVAMMVERVGELKNLPLPTFLCDVDMFHRFFIES